MKIILSTAIMAALAASTAQAAVKVESRLFHSNLRLDAKDVKFSDEIENSSISEAFFNAPGVGVAAVFSVGQDIDLGLGFSYARYYINPQVETNQKIANLFGRYNILQSETGKIYTLLGASSHHFDQTRETQHEGSTTVRSKASFTPIANYDLGVGGSITLAGLDFGVEYKYSNTLGKGKANEKTRVSYLGLKGPVNESFRAKTRGIIAEEQEVALSVGVKI